MRITLDPRTRIIMVLCLSFLGILIDQLKPMAALVIVTLAMVWLFAKGAPIAFFYNLRWILSFFLFLAMLQSVFNPGGKIMLSVLGISIMTFDGLRSGILFFGRMTVIMLSAGIIAKAGIRNITQGLIEWKIPYELAFMTAIAIRFLPTFRDEMVNSLNALQLRGIHLKSVPINEKIKIYTYLFSPVLMGVIVKAKELALAMEMKAFRAYSSRTSYIRLKMRGIDYIVIICSLCFTLLFLLSTGD